MQTLYQWGWAIERLLTDSTSEPYSSLVHNEAKGNLFERYLLYYKRHSYCRVCSDHDTSIRISGGADRRHDISDNKGQIWGFYFCGYRKAGLSPQTYQDVHLLGVRTVHKCCVCGIWVHFRHLAAPQHRFSTLYGICR